MYINASSSKGGGRNARETLTHSIRDCSTASSVFFFLLFFLCGFFYSRRLALSFRCRLSSKGCFFFLLLLPNSYFFVGRGVVDRTAAPLVRLLRSGVL